MLDFRGAGVLGATVILAGGVAYLVWRHSEKKPQSRPEAPSGAGKAEEEAVARQAERLTAAAAPPVIEVTPAPKAAQVQKLPHVFLHMCSSTRRKTAPNRTPPPVTIHLALYGRGINKGPILICKYTKL